jgi:hypothetical protein
LIFFSRTRQHQKSRLKQHEANMSFILFCIFLNDLKKAQKIQSQKNSKTNKLKTN